VFGLCMEKRDWMVGYSGAQQSVQVCGIFTHVTRQMRRATAGGFLGTVNMTCR
jgi:hypothetical protein